MKNIKIQKLITVLAAGILLLALKPIKTQAAWINDSNGWWNSEGESWSVGWRLIDGEWYYFNEEGYMKTGWVKYKYNWYYLNDNGTMAKNTNINGYDLNKEGIWIEKRSSMKKVDENETADMKELLHNNLIISGLDSDEKGFMTAFNLDRNSPKSIINNEIANVTGGVSEDGYEFVYDNISGEMEPTEIYLHNSITNQTIQVTHDWAGKTYPKIADDKNIYFIRVTEHGTLKIEKVDPETADYEIIDNDNEDQQVECFDIKNNKLIFDSDSRYLQAKTEKSGEPIEHTIFKADLNGENSDEVAKIKASAIDSISGSYDGSKIVIGGEDINGDLGYGIYEIDTVSGCIERVVTDTILKDLKDCPADAISHTPLAAISKDNKVIYFIGSIKGCEYIEISGLKGKPSSVFSYNVDTKEIKEVFTPERKSWIFDLSINY